MPIYEVPFTVEFVYHAYVSAPDKEYLAKHKDKLHRELEHLHMQLDEDERYVEVNPEYARLVDHEEVPDFEL